MHETGFAKSWSIGASLVLKIFHRTPVVCGEFSKMLISRYPRVRLIMQPSLLVKLPDFIFGIPNKRTIDANSYLTPVLQKSHFLAAILLRYDVAWFSIMSSLTFASITCTKS